MTFRRRQTFAKTIFPLLLSWFSSGQTTCLDAQTPVADSLMRLIEKTGADTQRVLLLTELGWDLAETHNELAAKRLDEAIRLAQNLQFKRGEAGAWNALGVAAEIRGDYPTAQAHYDKALELRKQIGARSEIAATYNNLGNLHELIGDFDGALQYHRENLRIREELRDTLRIARAQFNIAGVYEEMGVYPEAYDHVNTARLILEARNDQPGLAKAYSLLGHIRFELEMFGEARRWYERALTLRENLGDPAGLADALADLGNALDELGNVQNNPDTIRAAVAMYERAIRIRLEQDDQPGLAAVYNNLGVAYKHLEQFDKALGYLRRSLSIRKDMDDQPGLMEVYNSLGDVLYGQKNLKDALFYTEQYSKIAIAIGDKKFEQKGYKDFAKIYAETGDFRKAFEYRVKYDELRYKRLNETRSKDFERKEVLFSDQKKQLEIERQQSELKIRDAEIARARTMRNALTGGAIALLLLAGLLFNRNRIRARANNELASKNAMIEAERERADKLLKNILPASTAEELKHHSTVRPVRYESVTVLFSDFKGFTKIAELVSPEVLIEELDECFRMFDAVMEKFGLEKIKTIGDSYMCAGGLPTPNDTHPLDVVQAAIEMQQRLQELMTLKAAAGKPAFEMRIGIHTGPVVAGVVGSHKFAYDIWGDTVNTAARMEQGSEPGKINISETTYQRVKSHYPCTFRGRLAAKNKGEVEMYFVEY